MIFTWEAGVRLDANSEFESCMHNFERTTSWSQIRKRDNAALKLEDSDLYLLLLSDTKSFHSFEFKCFLRSYTASTSFPASSDDN